MTEPCPKCGRYMTHVRSDFVNGVPFYQYCPECEPQKAPDTPTPKDTDDA